MKIKNLYQDKNWHEFRNSVIELDGYKCSTCGRNHNEVVLQVHHRKYIPGRRPWEYATNECKTLCKGCHASEHGIVMPKVGWEYIGDEDLGDLIGTCDNCGSSLRYQFFIFHEKWGTIVVGTHCCDMLTDSTIASSFIESEKRFDDRRKRFINSKRWKYKDETFIIKQSGFDITIYNYDSYFTIKINGMKSFKEYPSIIAAKEKVFNTIESGDLIKYLIKKNIPFKQKDRLSRRGKRICIK